MAQMACVVRHVTECRQAREGLSDGLLPGRRFDPRLRTRWVALATRPVAIDCITTRVSDKAFRGYRQELAGPQRGAAGWIRYPTAGSRWVLVPAAGVSATADAVELQRAPILHFRVDGILSGCLDLKYAFGCGDFAAYGQRQFPIPLGNLALAGQQITALDSLHPARFEAQR